MAKSSSSLSPEVREQKETELARLRKMRASLPKEKKAAGQQIDRRVEELEKLLRGPGGGAGGALKLALFGLVAVVGLALGFVGMMTAGQMLQP
ncbi:hypothetical protein [Roseospira visakhapatnamensis]|uniref:Uncharacterized protein n=1 Tax=Roseospira visakhapatnamensis TaxID=390880 RepID=A0A7W6RCV1_9PROT|nr:hypothetical protein [Roseospira visakhapatnamensis]MBB4266199.1 hypothetical protein [Roseospira visakhapatnamensis]